MLRNLSETVIVPIAAAILALVMCHELIQMIAEKNNMHDFDSSMFFRWIFKSLPLPSSLSANTWNIVMGVFDATQQRCQPKRRRDHRRIPAIDFDAPDTRIWNVSLESNGPLGRLLSLWFQTLVVGLTMNILSICIFLVTYGRMIEIYAVTALGPIPLATHGQHAEWRSTGPELFEIPAWRWASKRS